MSPAVLSVPLVSGLGYTLAALMLKRGGEGAGPWRVTFITNWVIAAIFALGWLRPPAHPTMPGDIGHAMISGAIFFVGQIFTFLALTRGDVSVATPVLGSKIVFVALLTVLLGLEPLTGAMWLAVVLTAAATVLLGAGGGHANRGALIRSLGYGFSAALVFALNDITQQWWAGRWDVFYYMQTMFVTMAVLSTGLWPLFRHDGHVVSRTNWRWLSAGALTLGTQACGVAWSIVNIGATTTNVFYNSRGVWSVVLVWFVGGLFGNTERGRGGAVMLRRLAGSLLLLSAIFILTRR